MCVITFYIIPYAVPTRRLNRFRESQTTLQILFRIVTMTYSGPLLLHRFPDVFLTILDMVCLYLHTQLDWLKITKLIIVLVKLVTALKIVSMWKPVASIP